MRFDETNGNIIIYKNMLKLDFRFCHGFKREKKIKLVGRWMWKQEKEARQCLAQVLFQLQTSFLLVKPFHHLLSFHFAFSLSLSFSLVSAEQRNNHQTTTK